MKKIVIRVGLLVVGAWLSFKAYTLYRLVNLGPFYRAKLHCSCLFVTEQSPEFCENWTRSPLLPSFLIPLNIDTTNKRVEVKNFLAKATAELVNIQEGCRLK